MHFPGPDLEQALPFIHTARLQSTTAVYVPAFVSKQPGTGSQGLSLYGSSQSVRWHDLKKLGDWFPVVPQGVLWCDLCIHPKLPLLHLSPALAPLP